MLSGKCKYAIRAVIYLAANDKDRIGGPEIAKALGTPEAFTVKVLQELAKNDILCSFKGPNGGFSISEDQKKIPVIKVVEIIDGLDFFTSCGIGLSSCSETKPCPFHDTFKNVRDEVFELFTNVDIGTFDALRLEKTFFITDNSRLKKSCQ